MNFIKQNWVPYAVVLLIALGIFLACSYVYAAPTSTIVQNLFITNLVNQGCIGTNSAGLVVQGTCTGGSSGGGLSTSTGLGALVPGQVLFLYPNLSLAAGTSSITITTSSGQTFFNVLGVSSSSEIRAPSGTIAIFYATNVSSSNISASNIFDLSGNKFVTSTPAVGATGISTSTWLGSLVTGQVLFLGPNLSLAGGTSTITLSTTSQMTFFNVFGTVSSTEVRAPSGTIATFYTTNVSSSNISASNIFDLGGNKFPTSTRFNTFNGNTFDYIGRVPDFSQSTVNGSTTLSLAIGVDGQVLFGRIGGGASSSNHMTFSSSSDLFTVTASTSLATVSSTNLFANGYMSVLAGVNIAPFQVASSSGRIVFQVMLNGAASSTEFYSPSSTITNLISTNVSGTNITAQNIFDNLGNKYVTSTSGGTGGGLATSSPWNNNALVFIATPNIVQASSSITVVTSTQLTSLYVYGNVSSTQLRSPSSSLDALTFVNASGTNLFANGYLSITAGVAIAPLQIASSSGRIHFQVMLNGAASSTQFYSPSSTLTAIISTNVSGTNATFQNLFDNLGNKFSTSTGGTLNTLNDTQIAFGVISGTATSTGHMTFTTSSDLFSVTASSSFATVSSTNLFASGYISTVNLFATNVSSTNVSSSFMSVGTTTCPVVNCPFIVATTSLSIAVLSNGAIVMGTSSAPGNALLNIATSGTALIVSNNGFVGIGTSSSAFALTVANNSGAPSKIVVDNSTPNPGFFFQVQGSSTSQSNYRSNFLSIASSGLASFPFWATSTSPIGGASLAAGACASTTVNMPTSVSSTIVLVSPQGNPGDSSFWKGNFVTAGVATTTYAVYVCEAAIGTPTKMSYNVSILGIGL